MSKLLTVFGATGIQGGSVIRAVLADPVLSKTFHIRGVTRDASKGSAQALKQKGIEVVAADMNSRESLAQALKGTDTLFLVTLPDFATGSAPGTEFEHGKNVVDAAKDAGVKHIVFSSLLNITEVSKGRLTHVAHFDRKADIENYIRSHNIPATFILPGYYMTNFTNLQLLRKTEDGSYMLSGPTDGDKAQLPLFYPESDMGKYFVAVARQPDRVLGKQIFAGSDYYIPNRIMTEFKEVTGKDGRYVQLDHDVYKSFIPPPLAQELLENELLCEEPGFFAGGSLVDGHKLLAEAGLAPTTWKDYLKMKLETFQ